MEAQEFIRKEKGDKPILAICYDFDKTLTPTDMQNQGFIQSLGYDIESFWKKSNVFAKENDMDQNLAYMFTMIQEAKGKFDLTKEKLQNFGKTIKFFRGVESWFRRIREYGAARGVRVEHYIISSGIREMVEGTPIFKDLDGVFACSFHYNGEGTPDWPVQVVNYTNKTQFLFRIEKGTMDVNDPDVNTLLPESEIRVPFRNFVYIGDSDTDIPCMTLVNSKGGYSIGVYNPESNDKSKVYKMIAERRIKYFIPADYSENSEMDRFIKAVVDKTYLNEKIEAKYLSCKNEYEQYRHDTSDNEIEKANLISALEDCTNFRATHMTVKKLAKKGGWTATQANKLLRIALENSQVKWILADTDVKEFYETVLATAGADVALAEKVRKAINP